MAEPPSALRVQVLIDSLTWGGAESVLADLALAAPSAGIELSIAHLRDTDGSPSAMRIRAAGVEPVVLNTGRLVDPRTLARVRRHLATTRPDILHTHLDASDALGGLAARSLGIPVVSTVHLLEPSVTDDPGLRGWSKRRLSRSARATLTRRVLLVSEASRRRYVGSRDPGRDRVETVHNGIAPPPPTRDPGDLRAELGVATDALVVTMVAVLREGKGHRVAFEAVARLGAEHPDVVLLVLGDGPLGDELRERAAQAGPRVIMAGHRNDVLDVLHASDVVLHPTKMDAFPTSLLEAAAAGLPAVATAVGGIPEIVRDGETGLLLPSPTADAVESALRRLLGDPALRARLGAAARARFGAEFTAERWALRLREIYDACLRPDPSPAKGPRR